MDVLSEVVQAEAETESATSEDALNARAEEERDGADQSEKSSSAS